MTTTTRARGEDGDGARGGTRAMARERRRGVGAELARACARIEEGGGGRRACGRATGSRRRRLCGRCTTSSRAWRPRARSCPCLTLAEGRRARRRARTRTRETRAAPSEDEETRGDDDDVDLARARARETLERDGRIVATVVGDDFARDGEKDSATRVGSARLTVYTRTWTPRHGGVSRNPSVRSTSASCRRRC